MPIRPLAHPTLAVMLAAAASALLLTALPAGAADAGYTQARQACLNGDTNQDRATCLREAGAAAAQARQGGLTTADAATLQRNATLRCQVHPAGEERTMCERMARGEGTTQGSVAAGGVIRELVVREPAAPAAPAAPK